MMKHKLFFLFLFTVNLFTVSAQTWKLIQPKYATSDAFVAKYNVVEQGADPTGNTDNTALFQRLLDALGSRVSSTGGLKNGGVLFVPEGQYMIQGQLIIPKGVTLRGEWEKPVKGSPVKGTILKAYYGAGTDHGTSLADWQTFESKAFITLQPAAAVKDLTIWYPNQNPGGITPYPPSILFGQSGYFGGSSCNATHITFINSYYGISLSKNNSGASPFIYGIYGTPLSCGIEVDNIGDVGRIELVDFSPAYWAASGLANAPKLSEVSAWIYNNGVGITMRRNDWSNCCFVKVDGYNKGYYASSSISDSTKCANGNHYGSEFSNCKYAVYADRVNVVGQMHTRYKITNCEYGFYLADCKDGVMQIMACELNATKSAIYTSSNTKSKVLMSQNTINKGGVDLIGGVVSMTNNAFSTPAPQITLGSDVRSVITGNSFQQAVQIKNYSKFENTIDHAPVVMSTVPTFTYKTSDDIKQKPARMVMYLATDFKVDTLAVDNSAHLQTALNKAKTDGGGIVFIPPGRYKFLANLTIPSGVELKGAVDNKCDPQGCGTVLEVLVGKGQSDTSTPFISMETGSGLRGVTFNYPKQLSTLLPNIYKYPYCVRGNANSYIVNTNFRATYKAIDLFTNKCDNHYVDYPAGHVFNVGIRVGGASSNGIISNAQFNCFPYTWGMQSKCGYFPNSPDPTKTVGKDSIFSYMLRNLQFMILGNCNNQTLYNNFAYGSAKSIILSSIDGTGPSGISLGSAMDASVKTFNFEAIGTGGFDFINTQIVSVPGPLSNGTNIVANQSLTRYLETSNGFTGKSTFYNADFWGATYEISNQIQGGTIDLQTAHFRAPGKKVFAEVASNANLNLFNSNLDNQVNNVLINGSLANLKIQSSVINSTGINKAGCGVWLNNIEPTASVSPTSGVFLQRKGWIATASVSNSNAGKAIDGVSTSTWTTGTALQNDGQWFKVDMLQPQIWTGIYLDVLKASDIPVSCTVSLSLDGTNWIAAGTGMAQNQIMFASRQTARFLKIEQTGSSTTSPWTINELYVMIADNMLPQTQNYFGSGGKLDGNCWSVNNNGPFTSAMVTTGGTILNFNNVITTNPTVPSTDLLLSGINVTQDLTFPAGALIRSYNNTGNLTVNVSAGKTFVCNTGFSGVATASVTKNGEGVFQTIGGTYGGGFTLNGGTLVAKMNYAMGGNAIPGALIINGGTIAADANYDFSGKYSLISIGGNFTLGSTVLPAVANANLTFKTATSLGNATRTITIGGTGVYTLGGVMSGSSGVGLIVNATAAGCLTLSGANSYTGVTKINAGTLVLGASGVLPDVTDLILNGGTLKTGASIGFSEKIGTLALTDHSTIALGTNLHSLTISDSHLVDWTTGKVLTITGWLGDKQSSGTAGRIFVGVGGLTSNQLAQVTFKGFAAGAQILSSGELVPSVDLPPGAAYQHFIMYGQSLSVGFQSYPSLSVENVPGNYMIGNQVWINNGNTNLSNFAPLISNLCALDANVALSRTNGRGEAAITAMVNHLQKKIPNCGNTISSSCGTGGKSIEELSKECQVLLSNSTANVPSSVPTNLYNDFSSTINSGATIARTTNSPITCPAIVWMQGEWNYTLPSTSTGLIAGSKPTGDKSSYKSLLLTLKNNMQSDVMSKYKQTAKPLFITYQVGAQYTRGKELAIGMAELEASNENEDVICAGPVYQVTDRGGHLDPNGYRWYGEMLAKAYYKTKIEGQRFIPLQPKLISRTTDANKIKIQFQVPKLPLVLDDKTLAKVPDYGFAVYNDNVKMVISSVVIQGDCVYLTCTANLNGVVEVNYAGLNAGVLNGQGNLRDNDNYVALYNYIDLDKKKADNSYFYPRDAAETTLRPTYEPKDSTGAVIYNRPYPLYNFCVAFYYKLDAGKQDFTVPILGAGISKMGVNNENSANTTVPVSVVNSDKSAFKIHQEGRFLYVKNRTESIISLELIDWNGKMVRIYDKNNISYNMDNVFDGNNTRYSIDNINKGLYIAIIKTNGSTNSVSLIIK